MNPARVAALALLLAGPPLDAWGARDDPPAGESPLLLPPPTPRPPLSRVYLDRWQQATTEVMAGPGASTLYRDTANRLWAWWRLYEYDRERPWLDDADADRARQLAELGALAGLERMLRATFERDETLGPLYRIAATVSGAHLEIRPRPGGPHLRYNPEVRSARAAEADIEDAPPAPHARADRRPRPPVARTGVDFDIIDADDSDDGIDPELALVAYLELRNLGVDACRVQWSDTRPGADVEYAGSWSLTLRQGLVGELSAMSRLVGQESAGWRPARATAGLDLVLPVRSPWVLRPQLTRRFPHPDADPPTLSEWRGMVLLQARLAWRLPQPHGAWRLGDRVDPRR